MLSAEDYYDILAKNERIIEDARHSQRRALEPPKNAPLQERYLQQASSLGLIPSRFCSPAHRQYMSPRSSAAKPTSSFSFASHTPNPDARASVRMRTLPLHDYAHGPYRPSRDQVARELARADASIPSNAAAAALTATSALSKRHPTPRSSRAVSGMPWRRTVSCPGSEEGSSRGSWDTRSTDSDSSSYSVTSKQSACNSTSTATASELSFSMSPIRRGALDKSSRDVGSVSGPQGSPSASEISSPRPRQSRQDSTASVGSNSKLEAASRLLDLIGEGSGSRLRGDVFGDDSRVSGYMARSNSDGGWWSQRMSGSSGQSSSGLLREPTEAFLRRWRSVKKKQNAKKQAVRFLLRTLDEGDLGGDNGRGASPPSTPPVAATAATAATTSYTASNGGVGNSSGDGKTPWGPGVVIVYPGSTVAFPPHPLPYSFSEALEAASLQVQQQQQQNQQQQQPPVSQMQPPRYPVPPSYPQQQDLREGRVWGAPSDYQPPPFGAPSSSSLARLSGTYFPASVPERASVSVPLNTGVRTQGQPEAAAEVAPSAPLQTGLDAVMQATFSPQQRPLPEYGHPQRQAWVDATSGQQYGMYGADMERDAAPNARNDDIDGRQEMSAAQRAAIARISSALQFFSGGGAGCESSSSSKDGWPWLQGRGSPGAGVSVSAGGASSSNSDAFAARSPSAYERLSVASTRYDAPLNNSGSSLHSDVSTVTPVPTPLPTTRSIPHNQTPFGLIRSQHGVVATEQSRFRDSPHGDSGGDSGGGSGGGGPQRMSPSRPAQEPWAEAPNSAASALSAYPDHNYNSHHYNTVAEWAAAAHPGVGIGADAPADVAEGPLSPGPGGPTHPRFGNEVHLEAATENTGAVSGPGAGSVGGRTGGLGEECVDVQSPITAQTMQLLRDQQVVISRDVQALLKRVADIRGRLRA